MSASRIKSLGKLVFLIGLPVAFVVGLFGTGVYCGQANRAAILGFERDWLGMDVEVPGEPAKPKPDEPRPEVKKEDPKPEVKKDDPKPEVKPEPPKPDTPEPPKPDTPKPEPVAALSDALPVAVADPEPLAPAMQARLAEPVKIRVKLVVDAALHDRRPDWIAYAQRNVAWASQVFEKQLGVRLELRGIVATSATWPTGQAALAALAEVDREGADLVIGLAGGNVRAVTQAPVSTAGNHAATAVAFANASSRAPHLRPLLRAVTHAMGGDPVGDPMVDDARPIAFTAADRQILLDRKHLPFGTEAPPTDAPAPTEPEREGDE
jgi:hypothetical protein